ncbi:alpha/beta fold hydrolase [Streptomyces asoensis]
MTTSGESLIRIVETPTLAIGARVEGPESGWPVLLLHGFPYDAYSYDAVTALLLPRGARVVTPYLRGFGPTRVRDPRAVRSGQQAAIGTDVVELIRESGLDAPVLAGFDWGGRAPPVSPRRCGRSWSAGSSRSGATRSRTSPGAPRTAAAFDNPDFVDVVVHSYRHRYGLVPGDARYDEAERLLADKPVIDVPTIVLDPTEDPVTVPRGTDERRTSFSDLVGHTHVSAGHDTPRDAPEAVAAAVLDVHARIRRTS